MQLRLPWNPNLIAPASTSAQGPETARQPDPLERHGAFVWLHSPACLPPIISPFKLQIKASSHMKCFWGLKLNYTTSTTTAATITSAAWWVDIHEFFQLHILQQLITVILTICFVSKLISLQWPQIKYGLIYYLFFFINSCSVLWWAVISVYLFFFRSQFDKWTVKRSTRGLETPEYRGTFFLYLI